ncbi:MAG: CoA-binding protein [Elusimicrobia bacterium]|nr:CoA-binding protein [Elusimicrobiota bacterium]
MKPTVAVIGASKDRSKFSNKAVRAYLKQGYQVFPVHPKETEIEGLKAYRSILDVPVVPDRVTVYIPPAAGLAIIDEIAKKGTKELFLNPGTESGELVERAKSLGLNPILACSIVDIGVSPSSL